MKKLLGFCLLVLLSLVACFSESLLQQLADHYREHGDSYSLSRVVELLPPGSDTAYVKKLLGEPIDMGFDYRYLVDSVGENNCVIGAVFHIDEQGLIDQQWMGEICE